VPFLLFAWAEERISSSRAGVLDATAPLFTLVAALLVLPEERPTAAKVAGLLLGFAGVVVVVGPWADQGGGRLAGQLACLLASALYGVGFVYTAKFVSGRGLVPTVLATTQLLAGTAILTVFMPAIGRQPMHLTLPVVASVVTLGALNTGIAYLLYHGLMRDAGATSTSLVTYLVPVAAVALGALVLDEPLTWNLFAGAAIVILGIAISEGRLRYSGQRPTTLSRT
jgi:drug/metabolite transporter (DMT)-like permease